jgi:outer membrane protein TolC
MKFLATLIIFASILSYNTDGYAQRVLTLDETIALALEHNLDIKITKEYSGAATSIRKASYTKFFPSFDITANYTRLNKQFNFLQEDLLLPVIPISAIDPMTGEVDPNRLFDPDITPPPTGVVFKPNSTDYYTDANGNPVFYRYMWLPQNMANVGTKNTYIANVGLVQPLYTGGKIRAQYNVSKYFESIVEHEHKLKIAEVVVETKELFYTLLSLQEKVKLAEKYKEMLDSLSKDVENYYEEGFILHNDLLKVRVKLNEADMMLLRATNGVSLASAALNRNIGIPLNEKIIIDHNPIYSEVFSSMDGLLEEALQNRPELGMANDLVGISQSAEKMARARYFPDVIFSANYFFANPNPYRGFAEEFGHDYALGITMRIPVYDWNEKGHVLQAARHGKKAMELKKQDALSLVELEVTKLYYELTEAASLVTLTESSFNKADENLRFAESKYAEGAVTFASFLEAQTLWQQAQSDFIEAKAQYQFAVAKLNKALGRMP